MKHASLAVLALTAAACLENEEEIRIRPDGSARVVVTAHGDLPDLAGGYPVPLDVPWSPRTEDTERWIRELGADTGSAAVRRRLEEITWSSGARDEEKAQLSVARDFASVADWPRRFAPQQDPYHTAYLERSAELEIIRRGPRTIYVFERVYHGVDYGRLDASRRENEVLGEVWDELDEPDPFTDEEWREIRDEVARIAGDVAELYLREAVVGAFTEGASTEGDGAVPLGVLPTMVSDVRRAADELVTLEKLHYLNHLVSTKQEAETGRFLEDYEREYRDTLRRVLAETLSVAGVDDPTINAVGFSLEWLFTAFDQWADLADEDFVVKVEMPGVLVGGNFLGANGDVAEWRFDGERLRQGDVVMRAVSVLE